jgi:hypothetical protein
MRGARGAMILELDGVPVAVNFGADFVAEHEWGIKSTYRDFGIDPDKIGKSPVGIASRTIQKIPEGLLLQDFNQKPKKKSGRTYDRIGFVGTLLGLFSSWQIEKGIDPSTLREFVDYPGSVRKADENGRLRTTDELDLTPLTAAWSDGEFAVFARSEQDIQFLKDLHQAMQNGDAAIWMGKMQPNNPFENAGLIIGIVSRMPADVIQKFVEADTAQLDLERMDEATGIKERLRLAGEPKDGGVQSYRYHRPFGYYALSPRAITPEQQTERGTTHPVIYWLNPQDQDNVNYGCFTVEELDQWIAGTGPIPGGRKAKQSA